MEPQDGSRAAGLVAGEERVWSNLFSAPRPAMLILKDSRLLLPRSLGWGGRSTLIRARQPDVRRGRIPLRLERGLTFDFLLHACST